MKGKRKKTFNDKKRARNANDMKLTRASQCAPKRTSDKIGGPHRTSDRAEENEVLRTDRAQARWLRIPRALCGMGTALGIHMPRSDKFTTGKAALFFERERETINEASTDSKVDSGETVNPKCCPTVVMRGVPACTALGEAASAKDRTGTAKR
jgi:hypothetical protein